MCRMTSAGISHLAAAFKALSNPNRLQIYLEVVDHHRQNKGMPAPDSGCGVTDFISKLNIGAPTVSHHVKALVDAGLIRVEKQGKFLTCYLNEALFQELSEFFQH
jgi:ArsR family transcriptional regulator